MTINKKIISNYYNNKRVLITGHTGFLGSWLSEILSSNFNANILGISYFSDNNKTHKVFGHNKTINKKNIDIRNFNKLNTELKKFNPEIIIHLAAQPLVNNSIKDPIKTFTTNNNGLINVLQISRELKSLKKITVITSDKVYENKNKKIKYKENDKLGGDDIYSASKAIQELITYSYYHTYFKKKKIHICTLRLGNLIGPLDQAKDRLIPDIYKSITNKGQLLIRNNNSTRPWQHVLESACLIAIITNKFKGLETFNIAPHENKISVKNILKHIENISKNTLNIKFTHQNKIEKKYLDISSKKLFLKYKLKNYIDIKQAIKMTNDVYNTKSDKLKKELMKKQIHEYLHFLLK